MAHASADTLHRQRVRGVWFGISDGVLGYLAVPPAQFHDIWSQSRSVSPERDLALAVVEQALNDLVNHRFAKRRPEQRVYWEAYDWVAAEDCEWPFSFVNLCDSLGLDAELTRRRILDAPMPSDASARRFDGASEATLGEAA